MYLETRLRVLNDLLPTYESFEKCITKLAVLLVEMRNAFRIVGLGSIMGGNTYR